MGDKPLIHQCTAEDTPRHTCHADAVADRVLQGWWDEARPGVPLPTTKEEIAAFKWGGRHNDSAEDVEPLTCVLIRRTCWHKAAHMKTCSKSAKAKRTKLCRGRLPGDLTDKSTMEILHPGCRHVRTMIDGMTDEELAQKEWGLDDACAECGAKTLVSFMLRKTAGSAWMPQANALLTHVFGCSNNVQYVYNCLLAFYIGMYASKSSNENTEGYNKAVAAYEKIAARQDALDARNAVLLEAGQVPDAKDMMTDFQKGLRRLHSVWNAHTKSEQVGAPRAAFFVLGYDGWIASRGTVRLGPNAALAYLQDEAMFDVMTVNGTKTPRLLDYVFRPEVLEELSWLEFVRDYDRCRMPSGETDRVMPFLDDHPDFPRIGVFKRTSFLYPQVSAKRLPDLATIETFHAALDDRALYAKNALTLTVPLRTLRDFSMRDHDRRRPFTRGQWWSPGQASATPR
jgi:hypothetical protein